MENKNINILETFGLDNIPSLNIAVLGALELFQKKSVPKISLGAYKRPLIVGSGNAEAVGRIIFETTPDAIFASESNFEQKLVNIPSIDNIVLVSASGEKHAPIIARSANKYGKHVTLITNNPNSSTVRELDTKHEYDIYVFPKNREPYTYNTSTYMGMIFGHTKEDPKNIYNFIQNNTSALVFPDLSLYNKYFFIIPTRFFGIIRMLQVKFIELFGRNIARDIETVEYMRHAVTVAPSDELFVSFGDENTTWGEPNKRLHVPLPDDADYCAIMAIGYFVIAKIQEKHPQYFKKNIVSYTKKASELFESNISPIVE
jgi:hypothetical protein